MDEFLREARALLPWLPESLIQIYVNAFSETQSNDIAIAEVRKSPEYAQVFPKNTREDGTVRLSEQDYAALKLVIYSCVVTSCPIRFSLRSNSLFMRYINLVSHFPHIVRGGDFVTFELQ